MKSDLWNDEQAGGGAAEPLTSLAAVLRHPSLAAVELSDQHTAAFPTESELPGLTGHAEAVRAALAAAAAAVVVAVAPAGAAAGGEFNGVTPLEISGGGTAAGQDLPADPSEGMQDAGQETAAVGEPMPAELEELMISCCLDNTHKPAAAQLKRVAALSFEPVPGRQTAAAAWLCKRLEQGLAEPGGSIAVSMKTVQLIVTLTKAAQARAEQDPWGEGGDREKEALASGKKGGLKGLKSRGTPKRGGRHDSTGITQVCATVQSARPPAAMPMRRGDEETRRRGEEEKRRRAEEIAVTKPLSLALQAIGAECGAVLGRAQKFSRLDPMHGLKPAKMINSLAKQVSQLTC